MNTVQDSDDKEVEELFKDSSDSVNELESFQRQLDSKTGISQIKNQSKKSRARDVDMIDLMDASVATDFQNVEKKLSSGENFNYDIRDEIPPSQFKSDKDD